MHCKRKNRGVQVRQYTRLVAAEMAKCDSTLAAVRVCLAAAACTAQIATCSWQHLSFIVLKNGFMHASCAVTLISDSTAVPGVPAAVTYLTACVSSDPHCATYKSV